MASPEARRYRRYKLMGKDPADLRRKQVHAGQTALVLATGPSMTECYKAWRPHVDVVVGVNAASVYHPIDYLVLVDGPNPFIQKGLIDRMKMGLHKEVVLSSNYVAIEPVPVKTWDQYFPDFYQVILYPAGPGEVPPSWDEHFHHGWLPKFNGTAYAAMAFASYIRCSKVILGGVDYTGVHTWSGKKFPLVNQAFGALAKRCAMEGTEVVNGSAGSKITTLPKVEAPTSAPPAG